MDSRKLLSTRTDRRHWAPPKLVERPVGVVTFTEIRALAALASVTTSTLRNWLGGKSIGRLVLDYGSRGVALYSLADCELIVSRASQCQPRLRIPNAKERKRTRNNVLAVPYDVEAGWEAATSLVQRLGLQSVRALDKLIKEWNRLLNPPSLPQAVTLILATGKRSAYLISPIAGPTKRIIDGRQRWTYPSKAVEIALECGGCPPTFTWREWAGEQLMALQASERELKERVVDFTEQALTVILDHIVDDIHLVLAGYVVSSIYKEIDATSLGWKFATIVRNRCFPVTQLRLFQGRIKA